MPWEEAIGFMVFLGAFLAFVGFLVGRAGVKLVWLSEGICTPNDAGALLES